MAQATLVKIDTRQLKRLVASMKKSPLRTRKELTRAVAAAQFALQKKTLKKNPVPVISGFLHASFRYQQKGLIARWFPTVAYAGRVNDPKLNRKGSARYMEKIEERSRNEINNLFKEAAERIAEQIIKI